MASHFDLATRLAALQDSGLRVASQYRGTPAIWLTSVLDDADVAVINVKGVKTDDTIVMLRLSKLEALLELVRADNHLMETVTPHAVYSEE